MQLISNINRKSGWTSLFLTGAFLLGAGVTSVTFANPHTTILPKITPDKFSAREELEGSRGVVNNVRIPHGCNGRAIRAMGVVFPNGNTTAVATDSNEEINLSDHIEGSPVSGPKPIQNHNIFGRIKTVKADGPFGEDVRAFRFTRGWLDPNLIGLVPWSASFPKFKADSCATRLKVNIAIANYCTRSRTAEDRADIWIGHFTPLFNDPAVVSQSPPNFWPHLVVVRDQKNNPLDAQCGDGFEIEVSPSDEDIDRYLPIRRYWPRKGRYGRRD